jgi:imidazolonepropionase-like amidohydrolase
MRAAVIEAHNAGKTAAAHALAAQGIVNALKAGVDTVEHGVFLDDEGIELFLKTGAHLCPTISVYPRIVERGPAGGEAQFVIDKSKPLLEVHLRNLTRAVQAGVKIVFGTDATTLYNPVGDFATEVDLMVKAGMSPVEVLQSATSVAARICRIDDIVGTLAAGKEADVLVVNGDATRDIAALSNTRAVFKAGELVYAQGEGYRNANLTARPILQADLSL